MQLDKLEQLDKVISQECDFKFNKDRVISSFDYGSTYQGTNDEYSDEDICYVYLTDLEDLIFNSGLNGNKSVSSLDARIMPLQNIYELISRPSLDSLLLINAQLERGNEELSEKVFSDFKDDIIYSWYVDTFKPQLISSAKGNLKLNYKLYQKGKLDGKVLLKLFMYLEKYDYLNKNKEFSYKTFSKYSEALIKDLVPLKRLSLEELKNYDLSQLEYCRKVGILSLEDLIRAVESILEYESKKVEDVELYERKRQKFDKVLESLRLKVKDYYLSELFKESLNKC